MNFLWFYCITDSEWISSGINMGKENRKWENNNRYPLALFYN